VIKTAKAAEGEVYPDRFFSSYPCALRLFERAEKDTNSPLALATYAASKTNGNNNLDNDASDPDHADLAPLAPQQRCEPISLSSKYAKCKPRNADTMTGVPRTVASYLSSTVAPASVSLVLISSASAFETPSFSGFGAPSTRSLASFKPRPATTSRTTLMTAILFPPGD